jgi:DNA repair exonuclease SbcCD ATPase subunit
MIEISSSHARGGGIGAQPIALAAGALILLLVGVASVMAWRSATGTSPEQEHAAAARQLQARAAQATEQLAEKTKDLESTQQEQIDQLQLAQDQLATVKRQLAAQQTESKRLSEQVSGLTEEIENLRQSFASAQSAETAPAAHNKPVRARAHAIIIAPRKRAKSPS